MLGDPRVSLFPFRQSNQRLLFILPATDLNQRILLSSRPSLRRLHAGRLANLLAIVRRPRSITLPLTLVPRRQLQETVEGSGFGVDVRMAVTDLREALRHRREREVLGIGAVDLV